MGCDNCKPYVDSLLERIKQLEDDKIYLRHQNQQLIQLMNNQKIEHTITTPLADVLRLKNNDITDHEMCRLIESEPYPAYSNIAVLLVKYTKDDSIEFDRKHNTFTFYENNETKTMSYAQFLQKILSYIHPRLKTLVTKKCDELSAKISKKLFAMESVENEQRIDTYRVQNMNMFTGYGVDLSKLFQKYKALYVS
jgi:predicted transcriptional regulator